MPKKHLKKTISIVATLALLANVAQPIQAAAPVAIPQNVRTPILTPAPTQTHSSELSFRSIETKISNVFKREKTKPRLAATYSGACGTGVTYNLDTTAGVLTISGSGAMTDYTYEIYIGDYGYYEYCEIPWYSDSSSIKTVVIENGVTSIGSHAFFDCSSLTEVSIPDSVTSIGSLAFFDCSSLTEVSIPDSVTSIGSDAFFDCSSLTEVSIPDSVTSIGSDAFYDCKALTEVSYAGTSDPGASYNNVFMNTQVTSVNVPWNYEDNTFCGKSVSRPPAPTTTPKASRSPTPSRSPSPPPSRSPSPSPSRSPSPSPTPTASRSPTPSRSPSPPPSRSPSPSPSRSPSPSPTPTASKSPTASQSPSPTHGIKNWFIDDAAWLAPIFTIASGSVTIISFFLCNDKVKTFFLSHFSCCHKGQERSPISELTDDLLSKP